MKKIKYSILLAAATLVALAGQPVRAATAIVVGKCVAGTQYTTIQAAVDAAPVGGTIDVCGGAYPEQVVVRKNLTLQGVSHGTNDAPTIASPATGLVANASAGLLAQVTIENSSAVNLTNIVIDGVGNQVPSCTFADVVGVYYSNSGGTVNKVTVRNQRIVGAAFGCPGGNGLFVAVNSPYTATVTVENSAFHNTGYTGIYAYGPEGLTMNVLNSTFAGVENSALKGIGIDLTAVLGGSVTGNRVVDWVYANNVFPTPLKASVGMYVEATSGMTISGNTIADTQIGIYLPCPNTNCNITVTGNKIFNTKLYDAIDVQGGGNTIKNNTIVGSGQSGVNLNAANGNTVTGNTIMESCAGILASAVTTNTISPNTYSGVFLETFVNPTCGPLM